MSISFRVTSSNFHDDVVHGHLKELSRVFLSGSSQVTFMMMLSYKGESTMHRAQTLWKSCLPGSKLWQASKKAAWKERHLMWLQGQL